MPEHLTRERIAALLDAPEGSAEGRAHLDECPTCANEYEAMSRARMALSALPDLSAPEDGWARIREALGAVGPSARSYDDFAPRSVAWYAAWKPVLAAAAVLLLFLAGLQLGRTLGGETDGARIASSADAGSDVNADARDDLAASDLAGIASRYPEYARSVADLRALRAEGPSLQVLATDPAAAAERLTELDALIEASREALRSAPADPTLNDFLFEVVDERATVAGHLDQAIRQASLEY